MSYEEGIHILHPAVNVLCRSIILLCFIKLLLSANRLISVLYTVYDNSLLTLLESRGGSNLNGQSYERSK